MPEDWSLRPINRDDNAAIAAVIRRVMPEFGADGPGFALHDPEVDDIAAAYSQARSAYFVVELNGRVAGGAGFATLEGSESLPLTQLDPPLLGPVCELRKMYFLQELRGKGAASALLQHCLDQARKAGFRHCYLETLSHMSAARALYARHGFQPLKAALGNTGHFGCNTFYMREL